MRRRKAKCELVWRILSDNSIEAIDETLKKKESTSHEAKAPLPGPSGKGVVAPEGEKIADEFDDAFRTRPVPDY